MVLDGVGISFLFGLGAHGSMDEGATDIAVVSTVTCSSRFCEGQKHLTGLSISVSRGSSTRVDNLHGQASLLCNNGTGRLTVGTQCGVTMTSDRISVRISNVMQREQLPSLVSGDRRVT